MPRALTGPLRGLLLFGPVIAVGVVALVVALHARNADPVFVAAQRNPASVTPVVLADALMHARDPFPGGHRRPATAARCRPGSAAGTLHNPWTCRVHYASGRSVRYRIHVQATGVFRGADATGDAVINGHIPPPGGG